jgi:hypothetical protein
VLAAFTQDCREPDIRFSVAYEQAETGRHASTKQPEAAWVQAIDAGYEDRAGAWVAEQRSRTNRVKREPPLLNRTSKSAGCRPHARRTRPAHSASALS